MKTNLTFTCFCIQIETGDSALFQMTSSTGTLVRLKSCSHKDDGRPQPWWKKRKERIFRKKTLFMRVPILKWLPTYKMEDFVSDLIAGVTVGITVIPQGLAYATVAHLPAEVKSSSISK